MGKHPILASRRTVSADAMTTCGPGLRCYLVEWYRPEVTQEALEGTAAGLDKAAVSVSSGDSAVQLLVAFAVPIDEVLFGVFASGSADLVSRVCRLAGLPAQRLSEAAFASIARVPRREAPDSSTAAAP